MQVTFDPRVISYGEILRIYFSVAHDPTRRTARDPTSARNTARRSFRCDDAQQNVAQQYIAQLDAATAFARPLATTIEPGKTFYRAEDYHQDFLAHNPTYPYIVVNDLPKVDNLQRLFPDQFNGDARADAVRLGALSHRCARADARLLGGVEQLAKRASSSRRDPRRSPHVSPSSVPQISV